MHLTSDVTGVGVGGRQTAPGDNIQGKPPNEKKLWLTLPRTVDKTMSKGGMLWRCYKTTAKKVIGL